MLYAFERFFEYDCLFHSWNRFYDNNKYIELYAAFRLDD